MLKQNWEPMALKQLLL